MSDLTQCSAEQLLALYKSGQASPVQATQQVLQRIARLNPLLNAFWTSWALEIETVCAPIWNVFNPLKFTIPSTTVPY